MSDQPTYTLRGGRRSYRGAPVERIASEVERIAEQHGECHPAAYVKAAKSKRSPLHPTLTWDDGAAAEQWRNA